MDTLDNIIFPINAEVFWSQYWQKESLLISRGNSAYYSDLLSLQQVLEYMSRGDIRYPAIRLVKNGTSIPVDDYTDNVTIGSDTFTNVINHNRLLSLLSEGATAQLQYLHLGIQSLQQLCKAFEKLYLMRMQTNIYLTPPNAQGFTAHYDTHDVFILQVEGEKTWVLYNIPHLYPLKNQQFNTRSWRREESSKREITLKAGDLLYIPRGMIHEAHTENQQSSLHITLGAIAINWIDIFYEMFNSLQEKSEYRKALPIDSDGKIDMNLVTSEFSHLLHKLPSFCNPAKFLKSHIEREQSLDNAGNFDSLYETFRPR